LLVWYAPKDAERPNGPAIFTDPGEGFFNCRVVALTGSRP
jgi:hypothetical protein